MLIILTGKSGTGKTTIIKELQKHGFIYPPSYTTRPKRLNDDKICIPYNEFVKHLNDFIEYVQYNGHYYGRKKEDLLQAKHANLVVDLEPKGLQTYIDFCKKNDIDYYAIYLYCNDEKRLENIRKDNTDIDKNRLQRDDSYFDWYIANYDMVINVQRLGVEKIVGVIQELMRM